MPSRTQWCSSRTKAAQQLRPVALAGVHDNPARAWQGNAPLVVGGKSDGAGRPRLYARAAHGASPTSLRLRVPEPDGSLGRPGAPTVTSVTLPLAAPRPSAEYHQRAVQLGDKLGTVDTARR